ncbi:DsrE/DsrF/DrsH-like family protein [Thiomicrorhabdus sp. ZW0627]|uniref:DsrE/DsrF/DrsH-like family protein n=1 Tax=Thiomicrorhabdus sp. ZW0627 TaxID=3039774 RepID=UPI00243662E1|nr:DsrE/DsrF/DrsH-like family protein [Thiomicrorhabdus sp. ZW0627]MDG6774064.1 DsrE/DsrF/DrsH-like family protein [Thiomicrorhabdus sp. ZW0627]
MSETAFFPDQFSVIQSKGTLDWAYASFILASTAAVMDKEVELFFTFYGLKCLLKDSNGLKITPLGRPDMVVKSPIGPEWLQKIDWNQKLPGLVWTLPGMSSLATKGFKKQLQKQGQLPFDELREMCLELGVKVTACQMTVDLMGFEASDFIEGIEFAGAPSYFVQTPATQSLFI